jgi:hypothetical protein
MLARRLRQARIFRDFGVLDGLAIDRADHACRD